MREEKLIKNLAAKAQMEKPPQIDVTDRVMAILTEGPRTAPAIGEAPLAWVAAVSVIAAVTVAFLGFAAWQFLSDPLIETFNGITLVMT